MSEWVEVSVVVDGEGAEAVAEAFHRYVHQGVVIEQLFPGEAWPDEPLPTGPLRVAGYFPNDDRADETRRKLEEAVYYLGRLYENIPQPEFSIVKEDDWAEAWKRGYHPIRIGERIFIKPAWVEVEPAPGDVVIEMDPGMAFGTGTHPTTQLCLRACEWFCVPGISMVDIGTGSGVLAIAAAKLGCHKVLALDIDPVAVRVAQENVERNSVAETVTVMRGSIDSLQRTARHFDLAMANLTARIILEMVPNGLQHVVWPGSKMVFSGIIQEQVDEVIAALEGIDLEVLGQRHIDDWVMLITQRRIP
ncbi:MAG TPA: 50S ribosomal protein L11 methyltransferase [Aggregatilineales bacterium]|nr:50S ribosomal protein L11 methyltransferase [Aggregatilineales bacterium]